MSSPLRSSQVYVHVPAASYPTSSSKRKLSYLPSPDHLRKKQKSPNNIPPDDTNGPMTPSRKGPPQTPSPSPTISSPDTEFIDETDYDVPELLYEGIFNDSVSDDSDSEDSVASDDTSTSLDEEEEAEETTDALPMRYIDDWALFSTSNAEFIHFDEVLTGRRLPQGVLIGFAKATKGNKYQPSNNGGARLRTSTIVKFNAHHIRDDGTMDKEIYLQTENAWYCLGNPSTKYARLFTLAKRKIDLLNFLVTSAMENKKLKKNAFIDMLDSDDESLLADEKMLPYILANLRDIVKDDDIDKSVQKTPIIAEFLKNHSVSHVPSTRNKENDYEVKVTPIVERQAAGFFNRAAQSAGLGLTSQVDRREFLESISKEKRKRFENNPEEVQMHDYLGDLGQKPHYRYATLHDKDETMTLEIGNVVMVNPSASEQRDYYSDAQLSVTSANKFANVFWFGEIISFFEDRDEDDGTFQSYIHIHWLEPSHRTFVAECGNSQELFSIPECSDNPIASVFAKVECTWIDPIEEIPGDREDSDSTDFFCGYIWDREMNQYSRLPTEQQKRDLRSYLSKEERILSNCLSCAEKDKREQHCLALFSNGSFTHHGITSHVGDFLFLCPASKSSILRKGKIESIKDDGMVIKVYKETAHNSSLLKPTQEIVELRQQHHDICRIIMEEQCIVINQLPGDGVQLIGEAENYFFVHEDDELCDECTNVRCSLKSELEMFQQTPLAAIDLFSGGGLLSKGLEQGGNFSSVMAVDSIQPAAQTFYKNHPNTTVVNDDIGKVLDAMLINLEHPGETLDGMIPPVKVVGRPAPLASQELPAPQSVDLLAGGPPCQAYSIMNHQPQRLRANDPKATLSLSMLSIAEIQQPKLFLLENVVGILNFPLFLPDTKIKHGTLKLLISILLALGYQVRPTILQAASYGTPQCRNRVILVAGKRSEYLPKTPLPSHSFKNRAQKFNISGCFLRYPSWACRRLQKKNDAWYRGTLDWAPRRCVTIDQAIGDLPRFDVINPHKIIPETKADQRAVKQRVDQDIHQVFGASEQTSVVRIPGRAEYLHPPKNEFQQQMCLHRDGQYVTHHATLPSRNNIVERMTSVPLIPGASHQDTPKILWGNGKTMHTKNKKFYIRLDGDGVFGTMITNANPSHGMKILHPNQKRLVTAREMARSQGLPDEYRFTVGMGCDQSKEETADTRNNLKDITKIIGNGVPVPLARALGREYQYALFRKYRESRNHRRREGSMEA